MPTRTRRARSPPARYRSSERRTPPEAARTRTASAVPAGTLRTARLTPVLPSSAGGGELRPTAALGATRRHSAHRVHSRSAVLSRPCLRAAWTLSIPQDCAPPRKILPGRAVSRLRAQRGRGMSALLDNDTDIPEFPLDVPARPSTPPAPITPRLFIFQLFNYLTNQVISHIPSFRLRHLWYRRA